MHLIELKDEDLHELILALEHKIGKYPEIWEPFYLQRLERLKAKLEEVKGKASKRFTRWTGNKPLTS